MKLPAGVEYDIHLTGRFGVVTAPVKGLYGGRVDAQLTTLCKGSRSIAGQGGGTTAYKIWFSVRDETGYEKVIPKSGSTSLKSPWLVERNARCKFGVGFLDGLIRVISHICIQPAPGDSRTTGSVEGTQEITLDKFKIIDVEDKE